METEKIMSVEDINSIAAIASISDFKEVIKTSIRKSGLSEKQVCWELDIDQGYWSKILSGSNQFPVDKLIKFCEIVSNDFPLHWLAHKRGYQLRFLPVELEEENLQLKHVLKQTQEKIKIMEECMLLVGAKNPIK